MQKQAKSSASSVSEKNTKAEIIEAYTALLSHLAGTDETDETTVENQKLVDHAAQETVEKIVGDLSQLRLSANQTISNLTERLTQEAERLANIKKAIAIAQKELEDTQKVKMKASQLYQMIETQKKAEEAFTQEMAVQRKAWEEEQKTYLEQQQRQRKREEEEYEYDKKMQRKRDTDLWEEEKQKHARQEEEKKKISDAIIKELEELRKKVATFPTELEKEGKARVAEAIQQTQKEAHIQQTMSKQEAEAKLKLAEQKIASLEMIVASLRSESKELKEQLSKATNNIKDIAVSVVEGSRKETNTQIRTPDTTK